MQEINWDKILKILNSTYCGCLYGEKVKEKCYLHENIPELDRIWGSTYYVSNGDGVSKRAIRKHSVTDDRMAQVLEMIINKLFV